MKHRWLPAVLAGMLVALTFAQLFADDDARRARLAEEFRGTVQPLVARFCNDCHTGDEAEAEVDLSIFQSTDDVQRKIPFWLRVREMLETDQMPPPDAPQPSDDERARLRDWVRQYLTAEAEARAGDPGPVVLRRLSNDEYTYSIRDLTQVDSLDPAREFPIDGAAGEGFTNVGGGLVMSPSLVRKFLDAAKEVADHAVLLPDGIRFSPSTTRRDWTNEWLARIQAFYARYTDEGGGSSVDLQGIRFDTNRGGRLPLQRYLAATLEEREAIVDGRVTLDEVAAQRRLNAKYLRTVWEHLSDPQAAAGSSLLLAPLSARWRQAKPGDEAALAAEIAAWQEALWKFNSVGHIGREGGPTAWMEPVTPLVERQDFRVKLPVDVAGETMSVYVVASDASDAGDGSAGDDVVWERPRLELPGRAPILLRDLPRLSRAIQSAGRTELARTEDYLAAVAELHRSSNTLAEVAAGRELNPRVLQRWTAYVDLGRRSVPEITGRFTNRLQAAQGYAAVNGWGSDGTPSLLTNRADEPISFLTLTVPARGVTVHPSPQQEALVAWQSPVDARLRIEGRVADADDKCGNGAAWRVELLSHSGRAVLAEGLFDNGGEQRFAPDTEFAVEKGDVLRLIVNARDNSHACDTTHIEWTIKEVGDDARVWHMAADIVDRILEGNPLPDSYGHADTWHFCGAEQQPTATVAIPPGSALVDWRQAIVREQPAAKIDELAKAVQRALTTDDVAALAPADRACRDQVRAWTGPFDWIELAQSEPANDPGDDANLPSIGVPDDAFGKHPDGRAIDAASLGVRAPAVLEFRLPMQLAAGAEFVVGGTLHPETGRDGAVQLQVATTRLEPVGLVAGSPVVVARDGSGHARWQAVMGTLRDLFPPALCYARIVPVDEVVTLTLFHREDHLLQRLMLDEPEIAELNRLWDELRYVNQEPLGLAVAFEQISEFATQDRPDLVKAFAVLRKPINDRAEAFRQRLVATEPAQVEAVVELAGRAWRRDLTGDERQGLVDLYRELRQTDVAHEEAIRLTLARVLASPNFLYRREQPPTGTDVAPVSNDELATRLSYFLWSSLPDDQLRQTAAAGRLTDDGQLLAETRRLLADQRTRRLAILFACQWLHIRNFDQHGDKNEELFPEFPDLRGAMYEESVRFFEDLFRNNGSVLDILNADHTFLNEKLAEHYGVAGVKGDAWRRVDDVRSQGRGGVLAMATVLASQSGASRTSPILRGNWVSETLLGERLPRPPANVPQLPETVPSGLTARQLIELHSSAPGCAKCHARIDPFGFALEQYDVLGRQRPQPVDTQTTLLDGHAVSGLDGLRDYLLTVRRDDFIRQFCRKLLGYALGREVQLSDEPLLAEMQQRLADNDYRFHTAVETIVTSRQFRGIRGDMFASP